MVQGSGRKRNGGELVFPACMCMHTQECIVGTGEYSCVFLLREYLREKMYRIVGPANFLLTPHVRTRVDV